MIQGLRVANRAIHRRTPAAIVASTANNGTGDDSSLIGGSASFSTSSSQGAPKSSVAAKAPRAVRREDRRDQGIIHQGRGQEARRQGQGLRGAQDVQGGRRRARHDPGGDRRERRQEEGPGPRARRDRRQLRQGVHHEARRGVAGQGRHLPLRRDDPRHRARRRCPADASSRCTAPSHPQGDSRAARHGGDAESRRDRRAHRRGARVRSGVLPAPRTRRR